MNDDNITHQAAIALIRETPGVTCLDNVEAITGKSWTMLLAEKVESMRLGSSPPP